MTKFLKFITTLILLSTFLGVGIFFWNKNKVLAPENSFQKEDSQEVKVEEIVEPKEVKIEVEKNTEEESEGIIIPEKININVPFTPQAPFAKWDEYHEEACEEASLIMLKYFLDKKSLNPEIAEKEIQSLIKFQIEKYGDYKDSDAEGIVQLAKDYYDLKNLKVVYDFKKEDIKKYLASGNPIIVPAAGRLLGNPYFTPPGPLYHNLVLTGYDSNVIITNDPGTKRGWNYRYDLDVLYDAIHDFPGKKEDIEKGRKAIYKFKNL